MPKRQAQAAEVLPTAEQLARGHWETVEAIRDGSWQGAQRYAKRRMPMPLYWLRQGWIDAEQAKALNAYEQLLARANYGRVKSCLDVQEGQKSGHWTLAASPRTLEARSEVMALQSQLYRYCADMWGSVRPLLWLVDELTAADPVQVKAASKRAWLPKLADELENYFR